MHPRWVTYLLDLDFVDRLFVNLTFKDKFESLHPIAVRMAAIPMCCVMIPYVWKRSLEHPKSLLSITSCKNTVNITATFLETLVSRDVSIFDSKNPAYITLLDHWRVAYTIPNIESPNNTIFWANFLNLHLGDGLLVNI